MLSLRNYLKHLIVTGFRQDQLDNLKNGREKH